MELRTYIMIDSMQPQFAALTGKILPGSVPVEGMAEVFMEMAPACDIYNVMDAALKAAEVKPEKSVPKDSTDHLKFMPCIRKMQKSPVLRR